jgi:hypothetical protein
MGILIIGIFIISIGLLIYSFIELVKSKKAYKKISEKNQE